MNPGIFIFKFLFSVSTCLSNLTHSFIDFNRTCTNISPMYTVQPKQSSGLNKYINILERNFYAAGQKLPCLSEKLNHLHKLLDTQTTLMSECSLKV